MATTTPNFGWSVPTSTDLVKDGATAIETLGDSIDASLVDLKGGTTGQVLKKNSGTDMDFVWGADSAGMTNPMTTTGDTIYSSSGSTPARLGIGTSGQVLAVSGGVPAWTTIATGQTFVGASCYTTAQLTVSHDTDTAITYNSEFFDTDSFHSTSSNTSRFTIPAGKAGKYLCSVSIQSDGSASTMGAYLKIRKNGSFLTGTKKDVRGGSEPQNVDFSQVLNLAEADYIEFFIYQNSGGNRYFFSDDALAGAGYGQISYLGA